MLTELRSVPFFHTVTFLVICRMATPMLHLMPNEMRKPRLLSTASLKRVVQLQGHLSVHLSHMVYAERGPCLGTVSSDTSSSSSYLANPISSWLFPRKLQQRK